MSEVGLEPTRLWQAEAFPYRGNRLNHSAILTRNPRYATVYAKTWPQNMNILIESYNKVHYFIDTAISCHSPPIGW